MTKPLVGLALGDLERNEDALAYLEGVLEGLQAGGQQLPVFVPEVGVSGPGGHDEEVIVDLPIGKDDPSRRQVDRSGLGEQDLHVILATENPADRSRDVRRAEGCSGHLVEQGLEKVVVRAVNHRDAHGGSFQGAGCVQPAEPGSEDHDVRQRPSHENAHPRENVVAPG